MFSAFPLVFSDCESIPKVYLLIFLFEQRYSLTFAPELKIPSLLAFSITSGRIGISNTKREDKNHGHLLNRDNILLNNETDQLPWNIWSNFGVTIPATSEKCVTESTITCFQNIA